MKLKCFYVFVGWDKEVDGHIRLIKYSYHLKLALLRKIAANTKHLGLSSEGWKN